MGCAGNGGDTTIDITRDPCAATPLSPVGELTELQVAGLADAVELWRNHGAPSLGEHDRYRSDAGIPIEFAPSAPFAFGHYDDENGRILINSRVTERAALSIVIAHELGHAFGLEHVTDRPSLMNPGNLEQGPTDADRAALVERWGECAPSTSSSAPP